MRASIPPELFLLASAVLALAVPGPAQPDPRRNEVIGITRSGAAAPSVARQRMDYAACATDGCALSGFAAPGAAWAGGAAVNGDVPPNLTGSLGGVWIANDRQLAQVDPYSCAFRCPPQPAPLVSGAVDVTGLAYWEDRAALLMSDSANNLYWIDTSRCQLAATVCTTWRTAIVPAGFTVGGLATDDVHQLLFVSASTFGQTPVQNRIWAGSLALVPRPAGAGWCNLPAVCELAVPACGPQDLGAITGLGFDACTDTLYITDGRRIVAARFVYDVVTKTCSLTALGCCDRSADPFGGLCVVQRRPTAVGSSCVEPPCLACPSMVAGTYGDAFLGNRNFALTLLAAPTGSAPVFCAIGAGGCVLPGVGIGFCATAKLDFQAPPLLIPMRVQRVGAGPCDGRAVLSIGVPQVPALCGAAVAVQWAMNCQGPGGGVGKAITNCLTFAITTN